MKKLILPCLIVLNILSINALFGGFVEEIGERQFMKVRLKDLYACKCIPEMYQKILREGCITAGIDPNTFELLNNQKDKQQVGICDLSSGDIMWLNSSYLKKGKEALVRKGIYEGLIKMHKNLDIYKNISCAISSVCTLMGTVGITWGLIYLGSTFDTNPFLISYYIGATMAIPGVGIFIGFKMNKSVRELFEQREFTIRERYLYSLFLKEKRIDAIQVCLKDLLEQDIKKQSILQKDKNKKVMPSKSFQDIYDYVKKQGKLQGINIQELCVEIDGTLKKLRHDYKQENQSLHISII
ncbi:MAG: hypothetical protein WA432_01670 [Candidatus Babeliaceae bacterium]